MANAPIGVSFLPSQENQAMGPKQGALEGDLGQAFKILSLRLPSVQGAPGLTPPSNLMSPGAAGSPGGFNPQAAIFEALLRAMAGGGTGNTGPQAAGAIGIPTPPGPPRIIPGNQFGGRSTGMPPVPATPSAPPTMRPGPFTRDGSY